ncbi:hypothetical protein DFP72DRAFT_1072555 [Ephemerocybe angulata]|uniref:Uncharacterized protein n=1 Tax=Ephemerocybe angulata TaxID=980116 RepID=A0A8H6HPZ3_9AGAR|nr:hypothetical protein DFP72DRAFT_1072555 [Tulosesus angulatus]
MTRKKRPRPATTLVEEQVVLPSPRHEEERSTKSNLGVGVPKYVSFRKGVNHDWRYYSGTGPPIGAGCLADVYYDKGSKETWICDEQGVWGVPDEG